MRVIRVVPAVLSMIVLAAHFLRSGNLLVVGLVLTSPLILLVPCSAAVRVLQVLLTLGFIEWMRTSWVLASMREAAGMPWTRMMIILSVVGLFTLLSGVFLEGTARRRKLRSWAPSHHQPR